MKKFFRVFFVFLLIFVFVGGVASDIVAVSAFAEDTVVDNSVNIDKMYYIKGENFKFSYMKKAVWTSSNSGVVKVCTNKPQRKIKLKAVGVGDAVITASINGKPVMYYYISVVKPEIAIKNGYNYPGDTNMVAITGLTEEAFKALRGNFKWKTSNRRVVRIVNGWPKAMKPGKATLKLYYKGKYIGKATVGVTNKPLSRK